MVEGGSQTILYMQVQAHQYPPDTRPGEPNRTTKTHHTTTTQGKQGILGIKASVSDGFKSTDIVLRDTHRALHAKHTLIYIKGKRF